MSLPLSEDSYRLNGYHSSPRIEVPTKRKLPLLHIGLFLATLVTTSMAGAFQQGANPFADPATLLEGLPFSLTLMSILLCHEMGHFLLHRDITFARARDEDVPIYRDSEWQADTFAGALMMSRRHMDQFTCPADAAAKCGMSGAAALYQFNINKETEGRR